MHWSLQTKLIVRFAVAILITGVAAILVYRNTRERIESDLLVIQGHEARARLGRVSSLAVDLETGMRGYVITGKDEFLEPYLKAKTQLPEELKLLRQLLAGHANQQHGLLTLEKLIADQLAFRAGVVSAVRAQGPEAGRKMVFTGQGKAEMDAIRRVSGGMEAEEVRLLHEQRRLSASTGRAVVWSQVGLVGLIAVMLAGAFVQVRRHLDDRARAEEALREREENLAVTLHSIGDGVLATDANGRVTRLNVVAERLTGWTETEARGRDVDEVFRIINEETRQPAVVPVEKVISTGLVAGLANHTVLVARGGSECPIADSAAPVRTKEGKLLGVVLVFRDVSAERAAEEVLKASQERYRQVTETAPFALFVQSEGRFAYINPAGVAMFGANRAEEMVGKRVLDHVHPDSREAVRERIRRLNEEAIPAVPRESQFLRLDGRAFWGEATANPVTYQGKPGAVVVLQDITRRKAAELTAAENEVRLRAISANLPGGVVFQAVQEGDAYRFTYISSGIEALAGLPPEEILADFTALKSIIVEESGVGIWQEAGRAADQLKPFDREVRIRHRAGEGRWVHVRAMPRRRSDGGIQWDGVVLDVTARKQAEEEILRLNRGLEQMVAERTAELREAEIRYRTLFEESPDGVVVIDPEGTAQLEFNETACRQLGYSREEFARLRIQDYEVIENPDETRERIARILRGGRESFETQHRTKSGEIRDILVTVRRFELGGKALLHCVYHDITERRKAEATLKESQERLRLLFQHVTEYAIMGLDPNGVVTTWNPGAERVLGWTSEEIVGRPHSLFWPPEEAEAGVPDDLLRRAEEAGRAEYHGWRVRKDGSRFWSDVVVAPQWDEGGRLRGFSKVTRDCTREEEAKSVIHAHQDRLAVAQRLGRLGDWHWDLRTKQLTWSPEVYEIFEDDPEAGEPTMDGFEARIHAEDLPQYKEAMRALLASRSPVAFDFRIVRPDGGLRWLNSQAFVGTGEDGEPVRLFGTVQDVTERRRADEAVKEAETRLRFALESTGAGAWDLDLEDHTAYRTLQHDRIFGYSELLPQWTYEMFLDHVLPEDRDAVDAKFRDAAATGGDWSFECRIRRTDGVVRWISASGRHMWDAAGMRRRVAGIVQDITERKQLEEQFNQSQKMESIGRLAGGVAHDFNNLLTVITGYGDLLLGKLDPRDPMYGSLTEMMKAGERATELTQQLLAFSRRQIIEPRVLELNQVIHDVEKMLRRVLGEDIDLKTALEPELGRMKADPGQLTQILMNLAVNARDAMPNGGHLLIETANVDIDRRYAREHFDIEPGSYVQLVVGDSGIGMDEATKARIFEPFFTTKKSGEGTGLGLAMVHGIVKQSGGSIYVYSEAGHGTIFKLYFPRVEEAPSVDEPAAEIGTLSGRETILLVEDQVDLRRLAETVLKSYGYQVLEAANGGEALLKAESHAGPIHLLLTDVVLTGINGRELAERLKPLRPGMRVLYMSGYTENVIAHRGILKEGVEYLAKPFSPEGLAWKVRQVLGPARPAGTILVVDDEAGIRSLLRQVLQGAGYEVLEAEDGKKAMAQAARAEVDLMITDLAMPDQEGLETIQLLRNQRPELKIIAMSGAFEGEYLKVAEMLGARASMGKPIRPQVLLKTVREVLEGA